MSLSFVSSFARPDDDDISSPCHWSVGRLVGLFAFSFRCRSPALIGWLVSAACPVVLCCPVDWFGLVCSPMDVCMMYVCMYVYMCVCLLAIRSLYTGLVPPHCFPCISLIGWAIGLSYWVDVDLQVLCACHVLFSPLNVTGLVCCHTDRACSFPFSFYVCMYVCIQTDR